MIEAILTKLLDLEFISFFPLNDRPNTTKSVLSLVGIYFSAAVVMGLLIYFLGNVAVLGTIFKILGAVVGLYSIVGMIAALMKYMKYN